MAQALGGPVLIAGAAELTVDHVANRLFIVLAKVDDTSFGLLELVAASSVEEPRPRAEYRSMYRPLLLFADHR